MAHTIALEVVAPDRLVFSDLVERFWLSGVSGDLGVLPGHAPLLATLKPGLLHYRVAGEERVMTVMGGFLNVQAQKATVLTEAAELGEEIDALRAQQARERAEAALSKFNEASSEIALQKALVRLKAVNLLGGLSRRG
jgi:F-type H+-transporting ATPase subunit epsilon